MQQINNNFIKLYHITHWLILRVWWLLKEPFFVWAYTMIKPSSLKDLLLLTSLTLPSLSRWTSLGRESLFHHKVVYNVDDGRSLRQKSIHHERENTMLFSSIRAVNGRPFLHRSFPVHHILIKCLVTKLRTNQNVRGNQHLSGVIVCKL